jgi:hypothetical protein
MDRGWLAEDEVVEARNFFGGVDMDKILQRERREKR